MVATAALAHRESSSPAADGDELVASVHEVMQSVLRHVHPTLESEGISMGQFWALHLVSSLRPASLSTVARHLSVSAPTVCVNIDQLEASGLVTRHRSERDRRTVELTLTPKGHKVEAKVWAEIGRTIAAAAGNLPRGNIATAVRVFQELNRRLDPTGGRRGGAA